MTSSIEDHLKNIECKISYPQIARIGYFETEPYNSGMIHATGEINCRFSTKRTSLRLVLRKSAHPLARMGCSRRGQGLAASPI